MPEKKKQYECKVCGHKWTPRGNKKPYQCPNRTCGSNNWETGKGSREARAELLRNARERQKAIIADDSFLEKIVDKILASKQKPEPETRDLPLAHGVSCGPPGSQTDDLSSLKTVTVGDANALALATPGSWVAPADGDSMKNQSMPDSISSGDLLLLIPLAEWKQDITDGTIIYSYVQMKDGTEGYTLKEYRGKELKARNPKFSQIDYGRMGDVLTAQAIAVCAYRFGKPLVKGKYGNNGLEW